MQPLLGSAKIFGVGAPVPLMSCELSVPGAIPYSSMYLSRAWSRSEMPEVGDIWSTVPLPGNLPVG